MNFNEFRVREDGVVYSLGGLRQKFHDKYIPDAHADAQIPADQKLAYMQRYLDSFGVDVVVQQPMPEQKPYKDYALGSVVQIDGVWTRVWEVTDWSEERIEEQRRNDLTLVYQNIQMRRDMLEVTAGFKVGDNWFHSDEKSATRYLDAKDQARDQITTVDAPANKDVPLLDAEGNQVMWKGLGKDKIPMTVQLAFDLVEGRRNFVSQVRAAADKHIAAATKAEVPSAYQYHADFWPETYAEAMARAAAEV